MSEPEFVAALRGPRAYPHPCTDIRLVETHISWVFLTGEYAYKLKKPVDFGFLDFSTLEKRRYYCEEEYRCNSSFAPELYLGVVAVGIDSDGRYCIGDGDRVVEFAVKMRQFDDDMQLDRVLDRDALTPAMLKQFALDLAEIYAALPEIANSESIGNADKVLAPILENFHVLAGLAEARPYARILARIQKWTLATHAHLREAFEERARGGCIRERHGDLHLSNLVQTERGIRAFDCIEFNPALRLIDAVNDIAFLFMDCSVRGRQDLAYSFIDSYLEASGDYAGICLLRFYAVYRSIVRAKVAALRLAQDFDESTLQRLELHVKWARKTSDAAVGKLVLMCGPSGSGKSWLAERLTPRLPAIRIRSDVVRRGLTGLGRTESSGSEPGGGIYTQVMSEAVYARLLELSRDLIAAGETVIVDATFLAATDRAKFQALADACGCDCVVVQCEAAQSCLEQRVTERLAAGTDPSEATLEVLRRQLAAFEPPGAGEQTIQVRTDREIDVAGLANQILVSV